MKKLVSYIFLSCFLFIGCGEDNPVIIDNTEEDNIDNNNGNPIGGDDNDDDDDDDDDNKPPKKLLFTQENSDAKNKLLGLWSIIYDGMGEDKDTYTSSLGTIEFMPDGKYRTYSNYPDEYDEYSAYKISDDYYYKNYIWPDSIPEEMRGGGQWIYTYKFYDDKLRLELVWGIYTWDDVYIYKRLKP